MVRQRPEQLDIPLVWDIEPPHEAAAGTPAPLRPAGPGRGCSSLRLLLAALADVGVVLLAGTAAAALALAAGASLAPGQLALAIGAGLLVATVLALGCLWLWRGTPGMLVVGAGFADPLLAGRAGLVWLVWLVAAPVAGAPLLVGRAGRRGIERVAQSPLRCRPSPASA